MSGTGNMATKEELEQELAKARSDMKLMASMVSDRAGSIAGTASELASEHLGDLSDDARRMIDEAMDEGRRMRGAVEEQIRSNPIAAAAIAFAAGLFLAKLLGRK